MSSQLRARGAGAQAQHTQATTRNEDATGAAAATLPSPPAAPAAVSRAVIAPSAAPLCWRAIRVACLAPVLLASLLWTLALVSTLTHSYTHPLASVARFLSHASSSSASASGGSSADSLRALSPLDYAAEQTCEMSYFSLAHKHVPVARLTAISRAMVEGKVRYGANASAGALDGAEGAAATASPPVRAARRRRNAEYDEEEDEEDALLAAAEAAEELELSQSHSGVTAALPGPTNDADRARAGEFASFRRIFLNALPTALSSNSSSRYRLFQYVHHADGRRDLEKYAREPHPHEEGARRRSEQRAAAALGPVPDHNRLPRVPVLFLHGNGGSFHQMRSLASRLAALAAADRSASSSAPSHLPDLNDYFSVDFYEESAALQGRLGWGQAWFANEALAHILASYPSGTRAVLVGHSMAGLVARLMFSLGNFPRDPATGMGRVAMLVTLGSPHRAPVVLVDEWMGKMYAAVNARPDKSNGSDSAAAATAAAFEPLRPLIDPAASLHHVYAAHTRALLAFEAATAAAARSNSSSSSGTSTGAPASEPPHPPILISVAGGERDFQVEPFLTDLAGIYAEGGLDAGSPPLYTLSLAAHSLHWGTVSGQSGATAGSPEAQELSATRALGSVDHQCLAWCAHLVDSLAVSVREVTRNLLATRLGGERKGYREMYRLQREIWIPPAVPVLRRVAAAALAPEEAAQTAAESQQHPLPQWPLYAENFTSSAQGSPLVVSLGSAQALRQAEGVLFVWVGLMRSVLLCSHDGDDDANASPNAISPCTDFTSSVTLLAPLSHPTHTVLHQAERVTKRLGLTSTYLLHLPPSALARHHATRGQKPQQRLQLRFTMHEAAHAVFARVRPLRGGALRQVGFGMAYRSAPLPLSPSGSAVLPNRAGVYRWTRALPAGLDLHVALQVAAGGGGALDNDYAPPRLVALFSSSAVSGAEGSAAGAEAGSPNTPATAMFDAASYSDQLFSFYPSVAGGAAGQASSQPRMLHFYRSGLERTAVGLLLRLPQLDGLEGSGAAAAGDDRDRSVHLALVEQSYLSFLHSLFLQAHLLPQVLLGAALLIFAAQFDYLRREGVFPRPYELLLLLPAWAGADQPAAAARGASAPASSSSPASAWRGVLRAPLMWVGIGLVLAFLFLCQGGLEGAHILSTPVAIAGDVASGGGADASSGVGASALWSGWSFSRSASWQPGLVGLVLFLACVGAVLLLEALVYAVLWSGRRAIRGLWWVLSRPFRAPSANAGSASSAGTDAAVSITAAAASSPSSAPQRRYLASLCHRSFTALWVASYVLALLFSFSLAIVALSRLAGVSFPMDCLHFLGRELTAWASTLAMVFRLAESHTYYARDVLPKLMAPLVWYGGVHAAPLVVAVTLASTALHAATFPAAAPASPGARAEEASQARSGAAHKSSSVTLMLLVGALLILPTLLGSFRLHADTSERALEAHAGRMGSALHFWPPGAPRRYEGSIVAPPSFAAYDSGEHAELSSAAGASAPLPDLTVLVPLGVRSCLEPLVLVALCWVTLLSWCALHTPFAPPLLQSVCIGAYGLALLLVRGSLGATALAHLPWLASMLCLCLVPHALASALYVLHLLLDRFQGTEGLYDRILERERRASRQSNNNNRAANAAGGDASKKGR